MGLALPSVSDLTAVLPSTTDIAQQALLSLGVGVAVAGLKAKAADGTMDPLGLFHHVQTQAQENPAVADTLSMAAFLALPSDTQKALVAAGVKVRG